MNTATSYELLRRTLTDGQLVHGLQMDPQGTLERSGITDLQESAEFMAIFGLMFSGASQQTERGKQMQERIQDQFLGTLAVATEMKEGLKRTLE